MLLGVVYALIAVLGWGMWLVPSQNVAMANQLVRTFYVTLAVLLLSIVVACVVGFEGLTLSVFGFLFVGGVIWTLSGWAAFAAADRLGLAKAYGIWAPLNIVVALVWGFVLFAEFRGLSLGTYLFALFALLTIVAGILMIIFAGGERGAESGGRAVFIGYVCAAVAGVGWASYFIPIQLKVANVPGFTMWLGTFPLAVGMFTASVVLVLLTRSSIRLSSTEAFVRVLGSGVIWTTGNYGALAMMGILGTGKGFTIAQLAVAVNALVSIYMLKEPQPKSRAARITLVGVLVAMAGALMLGSI